MDQNHISGVLKHNAQFFAPLPQHIYPCCLPIVYVQLRLQIKGRNTDKKQAWKGGKYDICIFGTREKNELGSFPKVVQLSSQSGLRCGPLFLAAHPYLFHQVPLIFTLTNKLHPQFQVAIASSYFTPLLHCQPFCLLFHLYHSQWMILENFIKFISWKFYSWCLLPSISLLHLSPIPAHDSPHHLYFLDPHSLFTKCGQTRL